MALPSKKYTNWYKLCCLSLYIFSCFKGTREHKNQIFCTIGDSPTADVEAIYQRTRPYHRFKAAKTSTKEQLDQFGCWLEKVIILCLLFWWVYFFYMSCLFRLLLLLLVKYFSPFPAVKIGKKKCVQLFVNKWLQMIVHTFLLPIFTAAKDEKYFGLHLVNRICHM